MKLFVVGLSHRTASVEALARFSGSSFITLPDNLKEHFFLKTCNRVELYGASTNPEFAAETVKIGLEGEDKWYAYTNKDALTHLFRVASSLDAMVVGESQVMGQLKAAHAQAINSGTTGSFIDRAVTRALNVAVRIRNETGLGRKPVSIASVALDFIKQHIGAVKDKKCLIIGSGEMGALVAKQLVGKGLAKLLIANRTFERAQALADHAGGTVAPWEELGDALACSDIAIACAGAEEYVIDEEMVRHAMAKRGDAPIAIIDMSIPLAVDPNASHLNGVQIVTIDSLKQIAEENLQSRLKEVSAAELIVDEEVNRFIEEI